MGFASSPAEVGNTSGSSVFGSVSDSWLEVEWKLT